MKSFAEHVVRSDTKELIEYLVREKEQNPELFATFVELFWNRKPAQRPVQQPQQPPQRQQARPVQQPQQQRPQARPVQQPVQQQNPRQILAGLAQPVEDNMRTTFKIVNKPQSAWKNPVPPESMNSLQATISSADKLFNHMTTITQNPGIRNTLKMWDDQITGHLDIAQDAENLGQVYGRLVTAVEKWNGFKKDVNQMFPKTGSEQLPSRLR